MAEVPLAEVDMDPDDFEEEEDKFVPVIVFTSLGSIPLWCMVVAFIWWLFR